MATKQQETAKNNIMSLIIRTSHHYQRDQIRDDEMGGAHDTQRAKINTYIVLMGKPEETT